MTATSVVRRIASFVGERGLDEDGSPVVVGVSGGPDSVCLLHALCRVRDKRPLRLHVAHLDHGLRGIESRADATYVASLCARLGVPLTSEAADVQAYRKGAHLSLEEAAREVRYGFFAAVASRTGARAVLLGHTADDQVETVLLHLIRGAGIAGLRGMEAFGAWPGCGGDGPSVARPLLGTWSRETEAYCIDSGLEPRTDVSNRSRAFLRNRVRHELLPALRTFNPAVDRALLRLAQGAGDAVDYLDEEIGSLWLQLARRSGPAIELDRDRLAALPPALQLHALRRSLREVRGDLQGITDAHLRQMAALAQGSVGREAHLPGGLRFATGYATHILGPDPRVDALATLAGETSLANPGLTHLDGWEVGVGLATYPPS